MKRWMLDLKGMVTGCMVTAFSLLMGCGSASYADGPLQNESYSTSQYAVELRVRAGDVPVVILPQNSASTGYIWIIDVAAANDVVVLTDRRSLMPVDCTLVGVTGGELLQFKALRAGKGTFHASYVRSWDKHDGLPGMRAVITFDVK